MIARKLFNVSVSSTCKPIYPITFGLFGKIRTYSSPSQDKEVAKEKIDERRANDIEKSKENQEKVLKIEVITQEDKKRWYQKASERPFRTYFRIGGFTFGLTMVTNFITSLFDLDRLEVLTTHPDIFCFSLLTKSCYFGLIWPSFYIKALVKPGDVFFLYGGIEGLLK